ncbi:TP53-regulating kinase [Phytophthora nicotianae]|uniref:TP53-regulating kinase n=1 Tax=Phytophthora nicotianae TaxID=4792 RepID=A0A0W8DLP1_PHYNI|nr:TP53-regulating kinase [Phytophthora nicotianae]
MKIHAYVNRIVKSASEAQTRAKSIPNLTSHSFRRGGAQHANGDATLSAQWIFDRGSWNMTSTNKAFAYVFNTTSEDQKVARVLSGWDASAKLEVPTLSWFDSATWEQSRRIANLLFQTSICAEDPSKRLSDRVCEVLTASLIQHFPEVLERYPMCPYVSRMRIILVELGIEKAQVLGWSSELQRKATKKRDDPEGNDGNKFSREDTLINHQNYVISELVAMKRWLNG